MDGDLTTGEKPRGRPFTPGVSGNPAGKPKGCVSGRTRALQKLDEMLARDENAECLARGLEECLRKRPVWFFTNVVIPLLPKESKGLLLGGDRVIEWRGLLSSPFVTREGLEGAADEG